MSSLTPTIPSPYSALSLMAAAGRRPFDPPVGPVGPLLPAPSPRRASARPAAVASCGGVSVPPAEREACARQIVKVSRDLVKWRYLSI